VRDKILFRIYPKQLKFQLDRINDSVDSKQVDVDYTDIVKKSKFSKNVFGVFGYIKMKKNSHLILIEEASLVGQVLKGNIFKVEKLLFVPLTYSGKMTIDSEDYQYVQMIKNLVNEKALYFSYDIDLTRNMQSTISEIQQKQTEANNKKDISYKNYLIMSEAYPNAVDYVSQYAFNDDLLSEFAGVEYSTFKVPCILGYVYVGQPQINAGKKVDFYLISRKDCRRPGRRFITRGLDQDGNAANFVETEHVFVHTTGVN